MPLDANAVRARLTDLHFDKPFLQWKSYCQRIASLRAWSRDVDRDFPVDQVDYDWVNKRTIFADFMKSLKKNIPDKPLKQAEAIDAGLMGGVIIHILNSEQNLFLRERDVCLLSGGFLKGLRASNLSVLDYLRSVQWLPDTEGKSKFVWRVWGGKTTKEQAEEYVFTNDGITFDLVGVFANYHSIMLDLYSSGKLQPIDTWAKRDMSAGEEYLDAETHYFSPLFVTYNAKKKQVNNRPLDSSIITTIIRQRIDSYLTFMKPDLPASEREEVVKKYSSHSLKRGAITDSFKQGCTDHELRALFRFKHTHTVNRYIDTLTVDNSKRPKL